MELGIEKGVETLLKDIKLRAQIWPLESHQICRLLYFSTKNKIGSAENKLQMKTLSLRFKFLNTNTGEKLQSKYDRKTNTN